MDSNSIMVFGGLIGIVVTVLLQHERRLSRIESKIDFILRKLGGDEDN